MKKFEELERIQREFSSNQEGSERINSHADSPQIQLDQQQQHDEDYFAELNELDEDNQLTQEQLEEVFRRTSAFTVKSASLDPEHIVDMDALDLLQAEYCNNNTTEFIEEEWVEYPIMIKLLYELIFLNSEYYYVGDDFGWEDLDKDEQYNNNNRSSTKNSSGKKRLQQNDRQSVLNKYKILAVQTKDKSGKLVTVKKRVCDIDPSLPTYVKIPPRPIKASWAHPIRPLSSQQSADYIPPGSTYHQVNNLVFQDLTQYGSQFQAVYMDPPFLMAGEASKPGKIAIEDFVSFLSAIHFTC